MSDEFDLNALLQQAMAVQQQLSDAQEEAAATEVKGSAGGGSVSVTMTGTGEVTAVRIAPEVVDPGDVDLLEDLILAALRDAAARVTDLQAGALGGLGDVLGGLGGADVLGLGGSGALAGLGQVDGGEGDLLSATAPRDDDEADGDDDEGDDDEADRPRASRRAEDPGEDPDDDTVGAEPGGAPGSAGPPERGPRAR